MGQSQHTGKGVTGGPPQGKEVCPSLERAIWGSLGLPRPTHWRVLPLQAWGPCLWA